MEEKPDHYGLTYEFHPPKDFVGEVVLVAAFSDNDATHFEKIKSKAVHCDWNAPIPSTTTELPDSTTPVASTKNPKMSTPATTTTTTLAPTTRPAVTTTEAPDTTTTTTEKSKSKRKKKRKNKKKHKGPKIFIIKKHHKSDESSEESSKKGGDQEFEEDTDQEGKHKKATPASPEDGSVRNFIYLLTIFCTKIIVMMHILFQPMLKKRRRTKIKAREFIFNMGMWRMVLPR